MRLSGAYVVCWQRLLLMRFCVCAQHVTEDKGAMCMRVRAICKRRCKLRSCGAEAFVVRTWDGMLV